MPRPPVLVFALTATCVCDFAPAAGRDQTAEDRADREFAEIVRLLDLVPGSTAADVGAGGGAWTRRLALHVGPQGRVFATDVRPELVAGLRRSMTRRRLDHVMVVLGDQMDTSLPQGCCDAVLLRLVYHAFDHPAPMTGSLLRATRPGGRLLVIDFRPPPEELCAALEAAGFERLHVLEKWQGQDGVYAALFRRPSS